MRRDSIKIIGRTSQTGPGTTKCGHTTSCNPSHLPVYLFTGIFRRRCLLHPRRRNACGKQISANAWRRELPCNLCNILNFLPGKMGLLQEGIRALLAVCLLAL